MLVLPPAAPPGLHVVSSIRSQIRALVCSETSSPLRLETLSPLFVSKSLGDWSSPKIARDCANGLLVQRPLHSKYDAFADEIDEAESRFDPGARLAPPFLHRSTPARCGL